MLSKLASTIGLGSVALFSTGVTVLLQHILDPCNTIRFPDVKGLLTTDNCADILKGGIASSSQPEAATVLIFMLGLMARIEAAFFVAAAVTAIYTMVKVPFAQRAPVHLMFGVFACLAFCIDGSTAGLVSFGTPRAVYEDAKLGGTALMAFWALVALCNWTAFFSVEDKKVTAKGKTA